MRKWLQNHFIPHKGNNYKPHFVKERNVIGLALLVVLLFGLSFSVRSLVTKRPDLLSSVITGVLVDLTNSNRTTDNLAPLQVSPVLTEAAQLKANDMAARGYFSHDTPEGKNPWYWFKLAGYNFAYAGENLAINFSDSTEVVRAWMNSEGHRANILNEKFTEIGIAMAPGTYQGKQTIFIVELFGKPASKQVAVALEKEEPEASGPVASIDNNVKVLAQSKMFVAVENTNLATTEPQKVNTEASVQSSLTDRIIASPSIYLKIIYLVLGTIIFMVLVLFLLSKPLHLHIRNAVYVLLLLALVIILIYLSSTVFSPQILVE